MYIVYSRRYIVQFNSFNQDDFLRCYKRSFNPCNEKMGKPAFTTDKKSLEQEMAILECFI